MEPSIIRYFQEILTMSPTTNQNLDDIEAIWDHLKINLLMTIEEACDWTKKRKH